jgi:cytoskeleton-associated protein 5
MKEIYRQFGTRTVNPKIALKQLPKLFAHSDKTVRAEASTFTVVLYTWLGDAIRPSLADLKPLQLKELDEAFATVTEPGKVSQERFLRSQKAMQGTVDETEGPLALPIPQRTGLTI